MYHLDSIESKSLAQSIGEGWTMHGEIFRLLKDVSMIL